jgi:hypothetical protein
MGNQRTGNPFRRCRGKSTYLDILNKSKDFSKLEKKKIAKRFMSKKYD